MSPERAPTPVGSRRPGGGDESYPGGLDCGGAGVAGREGLGQAAPGPGFRPHIMKRQRPPRRTDPEGFEPSTAGLEIRSPIRARRRVRRTARNGNLNNSSTSGAENRYVEWTARSAVPETRHAAERLRGPHAVHGSPGNLPHGDMMEDVESAIVDPMRRPRPRREAEDRVAVRRHVRRAHREGDAVVGQLDETGELLVVE